MKSIRAKDLEWVNEQCYVTLVDCEPGGKHITILVERASFPNRSYRDPYLQVAIVVRCEMRDIKINGELAEPEEIGDVHDRLNELCSEAAYVAAIGQGYFSDPDAS